jgi:7-cyano-7-deazaguanine synthase
MQKIAVLSFSGGMDSSSLLFQILTEGYDKVFCYSFDYGQRHSIEIEKSQELVQALNSAGFDVNYQLINVRDVFSDSQSAIGANKAEEVPENEYNQENLKVTVVENRNVIFSAIIYGKALALSKKFNADVDILMGVHNSDAGTYPDTRPASVNMAKELYRISNYGSERIDYRAPFVDVTKSQVLKAGLEALAKLGLSSDMYSHTSSCYNPQEGKACGKCATCLDRLKAFKEAGLQDPIPYQ